MPQVWDKRWVKNEDGSYTRTGGRGFAVEGADGEESEKDADLNITSAAADLAEELGVDVSAIEGSGADGRITKGDVEAAAEAK